MDFNLSNISDWPCLPVQTVLANLSDWTLHWSVHVAFGFWYALVFVIGIGGNSAMVYTIVKRKRVKAVTNVFLISLAVSDMLLCVTAIPLAPVIFLAKQWYFGNFCCKLMPYCQAISVVVTHMSLCLIAVDRFRNILRPQATHWTVAGSRMLTLGNWCFSIVINVPYFLSHTITDLRADNRTMLCGMFCGEYLWRNDAYKRIYGTLMLALTFAAPLVLQCYCFIRILIKVRDDMLVGPEVGPQRLIAAQRKRRVMSTLVAMMVAFAVSWLPLTLVNVLRDYHVPLGYLEKQPFFAQLLAHAVAMTSVIWIPILYFWMSKGHRDALRRELITKLRSTRSARAEAQSLVAPRMHTFDCNNPTPLPPRYLKLQQAAEKRASITSSYSAPLLSDRTITTRLSLSASQPEHNQTHTEVRRSLSQRVRHKNAQKKLTNWYLEMKDLSHTITDVHAPLTPPLTPT